MIGHRNFLAALLGCLWCVTLPLQADDEPFDVPGIQVHHIQSRFVDQEFVIHVAMPPTKVGADERFPVMYLTDSNAGVLFNDISSLMQNGGDVPRFISVGIGYPAKHRMGGAKLRLRDLSPTTIKSALVDATYATPIRGIPGAAGKTMGGAPEFLRFIREELIPLIDENYPTLAGDRGFFGHSLGGLFGLYALLNQPDTFSRYIIGSPSAWWDDELVLKQAEEFVATHDHLQARVFIGAGALEEASEGMAPLRMVTNVYRLQKILQAAHLPGLDLRAQVFADESHTSVAAMHYVRGLQAVYDQPPTSYIGQYWIDQAAASKE